MLSCHRFRSNEVRLWLSVIAYNLGNLWWRLVLPKRIGHWSLTSLQQRLVKNGEVPVEPMAEAAALVSGGTGGRNEPSWERVGALRRENFAGMTRREANWCMLIRS